MAERAYTVLVPSIGQAKVSDVQIITWSGLLADSSDTGEPIELPHFPDRTVQIQGALGTGGVVVLEGTLDGANWVTLTDPQGNALSFNALSRIESITEVVRKIRPRVSAGDGSTNFTVTLLCRRNP